MQESIKILRALSDETRIKIIILVSTEKLCAKAIARNLEISEAAVSQQIKILKEANLLTGCKRGYHIVYELNGEALNKAKKFIGSIEDISKKREVFYDEYKDGNKNDENIKIQVNINKQECMIGCKAKRCCRKNIKED